MLFCFFFQAHLEKIIPNKKHLIILYHKASTCCITGKNPSTPMEVSLAVQTWCNSGIINGVAKSISVIILKISVGHAPEMDTKGQGLISGK